MLGCGCWVLLAETLNGTKPSGSQMDGSAIVPLLRHADTRDSGQFEFGQGHIKEPQLKRPRDWTTIR